MQRLVVLPLVLFFTEAAFQRKQEELGADFWLQKSVEDLDFARTRAFNTNTAKNVIIFLGDGMGPPVVTAGRIFTGQKQGRPGEEGYLAFERLPNIGLIKTYNVDKQVSDSAGAATAYLCGVKANYHTVGVSAAVGRGDCPASLDPANRAQSIIMWAQQQGKDTGVVTNTRITHATPAAAYAGSSERDWECDSAIKKAKEPHAERCKDIARQLVEDEPGRNLKVIFGGGRQPMGAPVPGSSSSACTRVDGRNLAEEWKQMKEAEGATYQYVTTAQQLRSIDPANTDYILGLFAESHMEYEALRTKHTTTPTLTEMVTAAITRLSTSDTGYVLLIEGGRIDQALHYGKPQLSMEEMVHFDAAVEKGLSMVDLNETLVIVTGDHSYSLTINGYPDRGNDILGTTRFDEGVTDGMEFTTLTFGTGPGFNFTWDGVKVTRANVSGVNTHDPNYMFPALIPTREGYSTHGGEDVAVYAAGPWSHLFHRVHEQNYVAHVAAYASRIGPFAEEPSITPAPSTTDAAGAALCSVSVVAAALIVGLCTLCAH